MTANFLAKVKYSIQISKKQTLKNIPHLFLHYSSAILGIFCTTLVQFSGVLHLVQLLHKWQHHPPLDVRPHILKKRCRDAPLFALDNSRYYFKPRIERIKRILICVYL